jgi:hypothetical protein
MDSELIELLQAKKKLEAIKKCQDIGGISFKEAKGYVEELENKILKSGDDLKVTQALDPNDRHEKLSVKSSPPRDKRKRKVNVGIIVGVVVLGLLLVNLDKIQSWLTNSIDNSGVSDEFTGDYQYKTRVIANAPFFKKPHIYNNGELITPDPDDAILIIPEGSEVFVTKDDEDGLTDLDIFYANIYFKGQGGYIKKYYLFNHASKMIENPQESEESGGIEDEVYEESEAEEDDDEDED